MQRFGFIKVVEGENIWIHCASVGEVKCATQLINKTILDYPKQNIVITTTTPTGRDVVHDIFGDRVIHLYFPIDLPVIVNRFVARSNPSMVIILEREIWPNLLNRLKKKNIPVLMINARLSKGSFKKYQRLTPNLIKEALSNFSYIATQDLSSLDRYIELGANTDSIDNIGNIKFDIQKASIDNNQEISKIIGDRRAVVFASTHKGEDELIITKLASLRNFKYLAVIVPRHPERFEAVHTLAINASLSVVKRSEDRQVGDSQVLIGDSMQEMLSYLSVCDVVFMGRSLNNTGGHNMLEPALLSKPIIFGPNIHNFKDIGHDLVNCQGAIQVADVDELFDNIIELFENPKLAVSMGESANQYLIANQGSIETAQTIIKSQSKFRST